MLIGYLVERIDGVEGGSKLSGEYVLLARACHMVLRCKCNADAASDDDKPVVIGGMSCCQNGDCGGNDMIISMVFCPIVEIILDEPVWVIGLAFNCDGHGGGTFSYSWNTYIHTYLVIILVFHCIIIIILLNIGCNIS